MQAALQVFLVGTLTVLLSIGICTPVITWFRGRKFKIRESDARDTDRDAIAAAWGIPQTKPAQTQIARRLDQFARPLNELHERTNRQQSKYHEHVACCVSCLGLALGVLGISLTILHSRTGFEAYACIIELVALALAFQQWWAARGANHDWVVARTKVELLRQWTFLNALFPPATLAEPKTIGGHDFYERAAELDAKLGSLRPSGWWEWLATRGHPGEELDEALETWLWDDWRGTCEKWAASARQHGLAVADFFLYLRRRPVRQLSWFRLSRKRLRAGARLREVAMALLFMLSVLLAACKAFLVFTHEGASAPGPESIGVSVVDFVAMGLLAITALSAALTTIYLSRNDRSLLHRYATQERRIEDWLRTVLGAPGRDVSASVQALLDGEVVPAVLEFERLMIDELIDWIHISLRDALELAP